MVPRSWPRRIAVLLLAVVLLSAAGFFAWASAAAGPMPQAVNALRSDSTVLVDQSRWLVFRPASMSPSTGLVFYPGGKVDARAYSPSARSIAAAGYLVVIPPMPLNLAVFAPDVASDVIAAYPSIAAWAVGGHSLGGSMAARFARTHASAAQGLVLWASYPDSSDDLSATTLKVVSIYSSLDGLATPAKIAAARRLLPPETKWVEIPGGNHGQFGWYGQQDGDNDATISREEQQSIAVRTTTDLLAALKGARQ